MDIKHLELDKEFLHSVVKNNEYNELILDYYTMLMNEQPAEELRNKFHNKIERIADCNSMFELGYYKKQKIKDFKRTNLCKDKFCNNCKKVKQASRMGRFIPEIEKYKNYGMYHLVLTSPNVAGGELRSNIRKQLKAFPTLIEYLKCKKKIRGLDFEQYGYMGAFRSLEVTYRDNSYHPHLHVLLIFKNLDISNKHHVNDYSINHYEGGKITRRFSDFEILIQKIWRLLLTGETVTKSNIDNLDIGYSCIMDKFKDDDYFELFKYMTKSSSETFMTYENFKTLEKSLFNVRQIQGYGCLFRLKDKDISDLVEEEYNRIIEELQKIEEEKKILETPNQLINDNENTIISRKKIHGYIRKMDKKNTNKNN